MLNKLSKMAHDFYYGPNFWMIMFFVSLSGNVCHLMNHL